MEVPQVTIKQEKNENLTEVSTIPTAKDILMDIKLEPVKIEPFPDTAGPNSLNQESTLEEAKLIENNDKYMVDCSLINTLSEEALSIKLECSNGLAEIEEANEFDYKDLEIKNEEVKENEIDFKDSENRPDVDGCQACVDSQTLDDSKIVVINHYQEINIDKPSTSYECFPEKSQPIKLRIKRNPVNKEERKSESFTESSSDSRDSSSSSSSKNAILAEFRASTTDSSAPKRGKKRVRCEETWSRVKNKLLKNSGKSYTSKSGRRIEVRKIKPPCTEKCILQCYKKISNEQRDKIFQEFWELGSLQRQRDFLSSCVESLVLKCRRISSTEPRRPNSAFYLLMNGQKRRICKTFLTHTLGITERSLRAVIKAKATGTGIVPEDGRGKHGKHKKVDDEVKKSVIDHINSIPKVESQYGRKNTTRKFIDGGLSVSDLYRNYFEYRSARKQPTASSDMYRRIFNAKFNIGFLVPKPM